MPENQRAPLRRRGFWLECAGMARMTVEAVVAVLTGVIASSIALISFGLDSVIEFFALAAYLVAKSAFCAFTSAAALAGLGLNAWPGW